MPSYELADRTVLCVSGPDAPSFLHGLLTSDITGLDDGMAVSAALLTPQGKIVCDMLVARAGEAYLIDCRRDVAEPLARRLGFYRLRAKAEITPRPELAVFWVPADEPVPKTATTFSDPRLAALGARRFSASAGAGDSAAYDAVRITVGVAELGADYDSESVFPHEANLDLLHGVDFAKGCFVGQEVVSRMQHRGTARKRFLPCRIDGPVPPRAAAITAGDREIGVMGSSVGKIGLALLRLDRLATAQAGGAPAVCGDARLDPYWPDWMTVVMPSGEAAAE